MRFWRCCARRRKSNEGWPGPSESPRDDPERGSGHLIPTKDSRPLAQLVAFLSDAANHPSATRQVTVVETHFAYVFLTDTLAYKLKKPHRYPMVDLSVPACRRQACEQEILLNRELAPNVYLGLSAITEEARERLALDGPGRPLEYLVRMRRLDHRDCLQYRLTSSTVTEGEIDLAAARLIRYYRRCKRCPPTALEARRQRWQSLCQELDALMACRDVAGTLHSALLAWSRANAGQLQGRWTVDAHGDLRPEHIYLGDDPVFIDRLEFNPDLRMLDPQEELAFLAMECERLGGRWVGEQFLDHYHAMTGDSVSSGLVAFYTASRALLWAVLSARHLATGMGDPVHWKRRTRDYLRQGQKALDAVAIEGG